MIIVVLQIDQPSYIYNSFHLYKSVHDHRCLLTLSFWLLSVHFWWVFIDSISVNKIIDQSHKSHDALSHIPQCTIQNRNVHISVLNGVLLDMGQTHCEICETVLLTIRIITHSRVFHERGYICAICFTSDIQTQNFNFQASHLHQTKYECWYLSKVIRLISSEYLERRNLSSEVISSSTAINETNFLLEWGERG